jgi:hypothetical protein
MSLPRPTHGEYFRRHGADLTMSLLLRLTYGDYIRLHRANPTTNKNDETLSEIEFNKLTPLEKLYITKNIPDWDYVQSTWVDYPDANDTEYSDKPPPVFVSSNPFGDGIYKINGRGGNRRRTRNGKSSTKRRARNMRRKCISRRRIIRK